ncbi:hypothetical protein F511_37972 [Dorcoceras hygrometricum]|uniref:Spindle pole body component 110-like n=1 Tax=Dorcoceras hygrometricum TaxID=472368 RepID=A0A2Z7CPI5_9LAMI|nr:hypothetical protein F511_37972 [Dorcoceras hygrometricum]
MVIEYKKLSHSFEEFKAEKESCATNVELDGSSNLQAALIKLVTENEELRNRSEEMISENQRLADIISSWTKSSVSLQKLHGVAKLSGDRTGLGYNSDEGNTTETSSTPMPEITKLKTMKFVRSCAGQPKEAQSGEDKIVAKPPIWQSRFYELGYYVPEKPRESWLWGP